MMMRELCKVRQSARTLPTQPYIRLGVCCVDPRVVSIPENRDLGERDLESRPFPNQGELRCLEVGSGKITVALEILPPALRGGMFFFFRFRLST